MSKSYRQVKKALMAEFDQVDHSTMDQEMAEEDRIRLVEIINQE